MLTDFGTDLVVAHLGPVLSCPTNELSKITGNWPFSGHFICSIKHKQRPVRTVYVIR